MMEAEMGRQGASNGALSRGGGTIDGNQGCQDTSTLHVEAMKLA